MRRLCYFQRLREIWLPMICAIPLFSTQILNFQIELSVTFLRGSWRPIRGAQSKHSARLHFETRDWRNGLGRAEERRHYGRRTTRARGRYGTLFSSHCSKFTNLLAPEDEWAKMNRRGQQHRKGFDVLMANGASKKPKRRQHVI